MGGATGALAQCQVTADGAPSDIRAAQNMVAQSEYSEVTDAWRARTCTITKLLHDGGRPCHGVTRHVTVEAGGRTYHVIALMRGHGYCTTW